MSRLRELRALDRLLDQRNEHPERLPLIDQRIRERFEQRLAIFVLDMCGFSRLTLKHGIIHYLALIRRMQTAVLPIVAEGGGRLVKAEADNVFAVFDDVPSALRAAEQVQRRLHAMNRVLPADWDVHAGIGIGFGELLLIDHVDVFGAEMNLASKLGEDLAESGDVLLTEAAFQRLPKKRANFSSHRARFPALSFKYYAWKGKI